MKRFWLFVYPTYYPQGGMKDFKGWFNSLNETIDELNEMKLEKDTHHFHIYDLHTMEIVSTSDEHCKWSNLM